MKTLPQAHNFAIDIQTLLQSGVSLIMSLKMTIPNYPGVHHIGEGALRFQDGSEADMTEDGFVVRENPSQTDSVSD